MPDNHKLYVDHTKETILAWTRNIGESTTKVVSYIFDSAQAEKQELK